MFIFKDEDVLSLAFRQKIIREISGQENLDRKNAAIRRYEMFRDKTVDHVMKRLQDQGFKQDTLEQMRARAANVSILKKITKKKARSYVAGVDRKVVSKDGQELPEATKTIQMLAEHLKVTQVFRRGDEARELHKNALVYCHPIPVDRVATPDGLMHKWDMTARVLFAHQFDVIPLAHDKERAGCVILSDYPAGLKALGQGPGALGFVEKPDGSPGGDGQDQNIANSREDAGAGAAHFVWWTRAYHFTTDKDGKIVKGEQLGDGSNPIKQLPFVELAKDQDGEYWGDGGDDLTEAAILINLLLTDFASILSAQGYGQPVLIQGSTSGKDAQKEEVVTGPHNLIRVTVDDNGNGDYKLVSTDPHPDAWIRLIEVYVALTLTTNNLSPRNISGKLDANTVASGVAKMFDESESTEDLTEAQGYFACKEDHFWEILAAWIAALKPTERLEEELANAAPIPLEAEVVARFKQQGVVLSEQEKLDLIKKRKEVGLTLLKDLIKMDNPNLSDEEAQQLLQKILEERVKIKAQDPSILSSDSAVRAQQGNAQPADEQDPQNQQDPPNLQDQSGAQ